jgi:hypothetical protein
MVGIAWHFEDFGVLVREPSSTRFYTKNYPDLNGCCGL